MYVISIGYMPHIYNITHTHNDWYYAGYLPE